MDNHDKERFRRISYVRTRIQYLRIRVERVSVFLAFCSVIIYYFECVIHSLGSSCVLSWLQIRLAFDSLLESQEECLFDQTSSSFSARVTWTTFFSVSYNLTDSRSIEAGRLPLI